MNKETRQKIMDIITNNELISDEDFSILMPALAKCPHLKDKDGDLV